MAAESGDGESGDWVMTARLALELLFTSTLFDLVEAASDRSGKTPVSMFEREFLGLSDFPLPGILERIDPLRERVDSFVSDLPNVGYPLRSSPDWRSNEVEDAFGGVLEPLPSFEGCWPIVKVIRLLPHVPDR